MSNSSILGAERAPTQAAGRDTAALGPSDTSDSGSDVVGEFNREESEQDLANLDSPERADRDNTHEAELSSDTDASGTGERGTAFREHLREGGDILPDRVTPALDGEPVDPDEDPTRAEASEEWIAEDSDDDELDEDEIQPEREDNLAL